MKDSNNDSLSPSIFRVVRSALTIASHGTYLPSPGVQRGEYLNDTKGFSDITRQFLCQTEEVE